MTMGRKRASIYSSCFLALLLSASSALAHKITGTDVATLTQLIVDHNVITGSYEVQYGELAGLEERKRMDGDGDGRVSALEQQVYVDEMRESLSAHLSLEVDDEPLSLQLQEAEVLPDEPLVAPVQMTLRFQLTSAAVEFTRQRILVFGDANQLPRLVHADISVEGAALVDIDQALPRKGALKQIRVQAPEGPVEAAIALKPSETLWQSGPFATSQLGETQTQGEQTTSSSTGRLQEMLRSEELSVGLIVFALVLSLFLGAAHALEPGHGKTIVAAYLIGSRGTVGNAIFLGGVVTSTHTFSVILLGLITLFASQYILPEQLFPWLGASSGLLIMGLGGWLFVRNLTGRGHGHSHGPLGQHHSRVPKADHEGAHDHDHSHENDAADDHEREHSHSHESEHSHNRQSGHHSHSDDDEQSHDHTHDHSRENDDVHDHEHSHDHEQPHNQARNHAHENDSIHGHEREHTHDHDHSHDQNHDHEREHSHSHESEHSHDHESDHHHSDLHGDEHEHDDHSHGDDGHGHSHVPQGEVSLGSLLALGISGGIVPCPGALVILLLAVALHRIAFGLLLIVSFSLGLAAVLIAIGILMVKARPLMDRFSGEGRLIQRLPLVSSIVIIIVGFVMGVRSLMEAGIVIINL